MRKYLKNTIACFMTLSLAMGSVPAQALAAAADAIQTQAVHDVLTRVTFDAGLGAATEDGRALDGGVPATGSMEGFVAGGSIVTLPKSGMSRAGYAFAGWSTGADGLTGDDGKPAVVLADETAITDGILDHSTEGSLVLHALWAPLSDKKSSEECVEEQLATLETLRARMASNSAAASAGVPKDNLVFRLLVKNDGAQPHQGELYQGVIGGWSLLYVSTREQLDASLAAWSSEGYEVSADVPVSLDGRTKNTDGGVGTFGVTRTTDAEALREQLGDGPVVAVIDTGAAADDSRVVRTSVFGDDGVDRNGHGTAVIDELLKTDPTLRVLSVKALGTDGSGSTSSLMSGLDLAVRSGAEVAVVGASAVTTFEHEALESAVSRATQAGCKVVFAAGDGALPVGTTEPCAASDALVVAAAGEDGSKRPSSNDYGEASALVIGESTGVAAARAAAWSVGLPCIEENEDGERVVTDTWKDTVRQKAEEEVKKAWDEHSHAQGQGKEEEGQEGQSGEDGQQADAGQDGADVNPADGTEAGEDDVSGTQEGKQDQKAEKSPLETLTDWLGGLLGLEKEYTKRVLAGGLDERDVREGDALLGSHAGVSLVGIDDDADMDAALEHYRAHAEWAAEDVAMGKADGLAPVAETAAPLATDSHNALDALAESEQTAVAPQDEGKTGKPLVALLDTGVPVDDAVVASANMTGEDATDRNMHATMMLRAMKEQDPTVRVLAVKALGDRGIGSASSVWAAVTYAVEAGADIINLSLAGVDFEGNAAVRAAIKEAQDAGVVVIAAAGNGGWDAQWFTPANIEGVVTVGSAYDDGAVRLDSNRGACVDLYVKATSTSQAAAKVSGWWSAHHPATLAGLLGSDLNARPEAIPIPAEGRPKNEDGLTAQAHTEFNSYSNGSSTYNLFKGEWGRDATGKYLKFYPEEGWQKQGSSTTYTSTSTSDTKLKIAAGGAYSYPYNGWVYDVNKGWSYFDTQGYAQKGWQTTAFGNGRTYRYYINTSNYYADYGNTYNGHFGQIYANKANAKAVTSPLGQHSSTAVEGKGVAGPLDPSGAGHMNAQYVVLTFDANEGKASVTATLSSDKMASNNEDVIAYRYVNKTLQTLPKATRAGYTFEGWYTAKTGGKDVSASTSVPTKDTTYYAHWKSVLETYTVSYNANGGTNAPASQTKTQYVGLTLSSSKPSRSESSNGSYTVTLNANGGTVSPTSKSATKYTTYTFKNWNTSKYGSGTSYSPGGRYNTDADVTLYAQWNTGSRTDSVYLPTPTRTGYDFMGWATSSSASSGTTGSYTPTGDVTLYATWQRETYTVYYDANGGYGAPSSQTKQYGITLWLSSTRPSRSESSNGGYTVTLNANGGTVSPTSKYATRYTTYSFKNWNTNRYGSGTSYSPGGSYTANSGTTLYAQWNTGSRTDSVYLPTPTRDNYWFRGWSTSSTASSGITGYYTPTESVTLYATWQKMEYNINFKSGNQSLGTQLVQGGVSTPLKTLSELADPGVDESKGWSFAGWSRTPGSTTPEFGDGESVTDINGDADTVTLYAIWTRDVPFVVPSSADPDTGSNVTVKQSLINTGTGTRAAVDVSAPTLSSDPTYGWQPAGWVTDPTSGTPVSASGSPSQAKIPLGENESVPTYHALFSRTVGLTYDKNQGTGTMADTTATQKLVVGGGEVAPVSLTVASNAFTRTGYTFVTWHEDSTDGAARSEGSTYEYPGKTWKTPARVTLHAEWLGVPYSVRFNAHGGSGTMPDQTGFVYGTSKALSPNAFGAPTDLGGAWTFSGWATSAERADAGTVDYADGAPMTTGTPTAGGTVDLYAVWTREVTFKSGSKQSTSTSATEVRKSNPADSSVTVPAGNEVPSGWTLAGWREDVQAAPAQHAATGQIKPSSPILYAVYERPVTFDSGVGGSKSEVATQRRNTGTPDAETWAVDVPSAPAAIPSWTANGWRDDTDASDPEWPVDGTITAQAGPAFHAVYSRALTLTYEPGGGTGNAPAPTTFSQRYNSTGTLTPASFKLAENTFTRTGYAFTRWDLGEAGSTYTTWTPAVTDTNVNKVATAQWGGVPYSVRFNPDGGSGTMPDQTGFVYGTSTPLAPNAFGAPTDLGGSWSFAGWATSPERADAGTVDYANGAPMTEGTSVAGGIVDLYAVWTREVTFKSGSKQSTSTSATEVRKTNPADSSVTVPAGNEVPSGWTLAGWREDVQAAPAQHAATGQIKPSSPTLYAVYERPVTFDSGVGGSKSETATQRRNTGTPDAETWAVDVPSAPAAIPSWTANGWRDDTDASDPEWPVDGTITAQAGPAFHAVYSRALTLTYEPGGGTGNAPAPTTFSQRYNSAGTLTPASFKLAENTFTRTGYTFNGWDLGAAGSTYTGWNPQATDATVSKVATAQWLGIPYTVRFNPNGGSGSMENEPFVYGTPKTLTPLGFTAPEGFEFAGWAASVSDATAGTVLYQDKAELTEGTTTANATIDLYAIWTRKITFLSGEGDSESVEVTQNWDGQARRGQTIAAPGADKCADIATFTELGWRPDTVAGPATVAFGASFVPTTTTYHATYSRPVTVWSGIDKASSTQVTQHHNSAGAYLLTTPTASSVAAIPSWNKAGLRSDDAANEAEKGFNQSWDTSADTLYVVYDRTVSIQYAPGEGATGTGPAPTTRTQRYSASGNVTPLSFTLAENTYEREGYDFEKWDLGEAGSEYTAWQPGPADTTVSKTATALWLVKEYNVNYAGLDGAGFADGTDATFNGEHPDLVKYNAPFTVTAPIKPGYTFDGWKIEGMDATTHVIGQETTDATTIERTTENTFMNLRAHQGAVTLTALWKANDYSISYDAGGVDDASGSVPATTATFHTPMTVAEYGFTRELQDQVMWIDDMGRAYRAGETVTPVPNLLGEVGMVVHDGTTAAGGTPVSGQGETYPVTIEKTSASTGIAAKPSQISDGSFVSALAPGRAYTYSVSFTSSDTFNSIGLGGAPIVSATVDGTVGSIIDGHVNVPADGETHRVTITFTANENVCQLIPQPSAASGSFTLDAVCLNEGGTGNAPVSGRTLRLHAVWAPKPLDVRVPVAIHYVADTQGDVTGPADDVVSIDNVGQTSVQAMMRPEALGSWELVSEQKDVLEDGEVALGMSVGGGERVDLSSPGEPERGHARIASGEKAYLNGLTGRTGGVLDGSDQQVAVVHWSFKGVKAGS